MIEIVNQDCIKYLNETNRHFDLIVADPPFNNKSKYSGNFSDNLSPIMYFEFTCNWIAACWKSLKPGAAFCIHHSIKLQPTIYKALFELELDAFYEGQTILVPHF